MNKTLLAAGILMASSAAQASPIYFDIGTNYDAPITAPTGGKVCDTCTSVKNEMLINYTSTSAVFDADTSGDISVGDFVTTEAGITAGNTGSNITNNRVSGFNPDEAFGAELNNGYGGSNWLISFRISGLQGIVNGIDAGTGLPTGITYGPGLMELLVTTDGTTFNNFMDITIFGGSNTGVGTVLVGEADFTNVDAGFNNLIHSADKSCNGSSGFFDIWTNCGNAVLPINFVTGFDTFDANATVGGTAPNFTLAGTHDGSASFEVPEPGTLGLLGLGLLGAGMAKRRKS